MKRKTKNIIIIVVVIATLIALLITFLLLNKNKSTISYDDNDISLYMVQYYSEEGVENKLDYPFDNFGIIEDYTKNAVYMSNFDIDNYNKEELIYDPILIVFVNDLDKDGVKTVKENLESYLYGMSYTTEDTDLLELYETGIVESGKNFVYMIISTKADKINEELKLMGEK